ncbi:hypothetical protein [Actinorugispora endophytica]|uniref:Uncharacterized protein n=1 Tax=Actinorugispora endophytica TaxID=1605990 RepID=A0A4V3D962_9ACTN|nr:hypothetical protein [Actinorugispora endophytica]TDQ54820.1 hypothetical protein EV190_101136 [Actinorugispora endophytica]
MRVSAAATLPLAAVLVAASGCGMDGPSRVLPGLAHPAASAASGHRMPEGATLHDYNGINLVLPPGWQVGVTDDCLSPPGAEPSPGGDCPHSALRIRPNAVEGGFIDAEGEDLDDPEKWQRPWAACPKAPELTDPIKAESAEITDRGNFFLVSGERVEFSEWTVACTGGAGFRTRAWFVAEAGLEFDVPVLLEDAADGYTEIVRSIDLSRHKTAD